jgi:hypothetical protein
MDNMSVKNHSGGVISKTHISPTTYFRYPVIITMQGKETELDLEDAELLLRGLQEAVEEGKKSREMPGLDKSSCYHACVIGSSAEGMSYRRSKLGR